jgi:K+-transporting ATPase KdpF subunit
MTFETWVGLLLTVVLLMYLLYALLCPDRF